MDKLNLTASGPMSFHQLSSTALLLNFTQHIDPRVNEEVFQVKLYLESKKLEGVLYYIPAYCSLTIGYDPDLWNYYDLVERIKRYLEKFINNNNLETSPRRLKIPVCYSEKYGLDLRQLSGTHGLSVDEIIRLHTTKAYRVYMLGFLPGFVYLGDLHPRLNCQRKQKPRLSVPAQSVGLAGQQTGVYPLQAPGGWQIIGRTPVPIFRPHLKSSFLFRMGDMVSFYAVSEDEFETIGQKDSKTLDQILFY